MNCKTPGCSNKDRIKPVEGQGSFQGFDVFHCPSCNQVANTSRRDLSYDKPLNSPQPAGISKAKNRRMIQKAGAPILPCNTCSKPVPHFSSSPQSTKGLCSECIRTSLSKPPLKPESKNMPVMNKSLPERIKSFVSRQPPALPQPTASNTGKYNTTKLCGNKKCGYSKNTVGGSPKEISLINCPRCKTKMQNKPFSPNF